MPDPSPTPVYGFDAFSPAEIAVRVEEAGVRKARLAFVPLALLGVLAGGFIGLGGLFFVIVASDTTLGFAASRVAGGICFSLGLILVSVAGAELFTGNNLIAMAWTARRITTRELARNWIVTCCANFIGAAGLAALVVLSGHASGNGGAIGATYLGIAAAKCSLPLTEAFFRGILCNILVCLAVWMTLACRSVTDRIVAIVFPIAAFVAAGFEHSVANMYFLPLALLLKMTGASGIGLESITLSGMLANLGVVIAGNVVGGSVMVAAIYRLIYRPARQDTGAADPQAGKRDQTPR